MDHLLSDNPDEDERMLQIQLIIESTPDNICLIECKPNGKFLHSIYDLHNIIEYIFQILMKLLTMNLYV
jgi:hypothetical protein